MTSMPEILSSDILIIGGGASGMTAAILAARQGASVRILERMDRVGKKLLVTGNGRCNLANLSLKPEHYHGADPQFISCVLDHFGVRETLSFFEEIGLAWTADEEKRVYPQSGQASSVLDLLRFELERRNVQIEYGARAEKLETLEGRFQVTLKNHRRFSSDGLILAAGGMAMKDLGSNGSGYALAEQLGHSIVPPFPALVKIRLSSPVLKGLKGVRTDGSVTLIIDGRNIRSSTGELLFSEDGLSGIPALQLSRYVHDALPREIFLSIDLMPETPGEELVLLLTSRFSSLDHLTVEQAMTSLIQKRLILPLIKTADLDHAMLSSNVSADKIKVLASIIKKWTFPVLGTRAWNEAQVTAGGIQTQEIDPKTMESRLVPGLYFTGEIMDVDGDCGGYNLQWAWSTGMLAGISAIKSIGMNRRKQPFCTA
jgi:predicted Rossmann fold flavoprotein